MGQSKVRNLITVGIFLALMIVDSFGLGMVSAAAPWVMLISLPLSVLIGGLLYAMFVARVQGWGYQALLIALMGVLLVLSGHAIPSLITMAIAALGAELTTRGGRRHHGLPLLLGAVFFANANDGAMLPILWQADEYFGDVARQMGQTYASAMRSLFTWPVVLLLFGLNTVCGIIGARLGERIGERHLRPAGLA